MKRSDSGPNMMSEGMDYPHLLFELSSGRLHQVCIHRLSLSTRNGNLTAVHSGVFRPLHQQSMPRSLRWGKSPKAPPQNVFRRPFAQPWHARVASNGMARSALRGRQQAIRRDTCKQCDPQTMPHSSFMQQRSHNSLVSGTFDFEFVQRD